jgi:hypothetical protein
VTGAILRDPLVGREFGYAGRTRSLTEYRRQPLTGRARVASAAREAAWLAWFGRNLLVQAAQRGGVPAVARLLGHRSPQAPY